MAIDNILVPGKSAPSTFWGRYTCCERRHATIGHGTTCSYQIRARIYSSQIALADTATITTETNIAHVFFF